jgi:hypothetical protein
VTDEVKQAVELGYHMYEVWHFNKVEQYDAEKKAGGIFTSYVNTFLKMKQEASGWPSWCHSEGDKHQYISMYYEQEGLSVLHVFLFSGGHLDNDTTWLNWSMSQIHVYTLT